MIQLQQLNTGMWAEIPYETINKMGHRMLYKPTFLYNAGKFDRYNHEVLLISPRTRYIIRKKIGSRTMIFTELESNKWKQQDIKIRIFETLFDETKGEIEKWSFHDGIY